MSGIFKSNPKIRTENPALPRIAIGGLAGILAATLLGVGCASHTNSTAGGDTAAAAPSAPVAPPAPTTSPATAPSADAASGTVIDVRSHKFVPAELEVKAGTTVTWKNTDPSSHTVTSGAPDQPKDGPLNGKLQGDGGTYSFTFKDPGEYPYFCDYHSSMRGKVIVK